MAWNPQERLTDAVALAVVSVGNVLRWASADDESGGVKQNKDDGKPKKRSGMKRGNALNTTEAMLWR